MTSSRRAKPMAEGFARAWTGRAASAWTRLAVGASVGLLAWVWMSAVAVVLPAASPPVVSASTHPVMVDAFGDTVPAGPYADRIVSLSPNLTEILFALGVDPERIVGVTRYCDAPPEAAERPEVGGIVDPSLEAIRMQRPDIVLAARGNPREVLERIEALGLTVFAFDDRTDLEGVRSIIEEAARLVGPEDRDRAAALLRRFRTVPGAYAVWADSIPAEERPTVYYVDPRDPDWTAGPGSHIDDLIRRAGGRNAVTDGGAWPRYSAERLVSDAPDRLLIALSVDGSRAEVLRKLRARPGWASLSALREGRICWIDEGMLMRPGPRSLDALIALAACLHPERPRPVAGE